LTEVPCVIRVTDADDAFILNVVENVQRRELSGRERVRAITLLAGLTGADGRPLGVREISRRTGLSNATISLWLRIDRQPALKSAVEDERVDIGRAMKLVTAPPQELDGLLDLASSVSASELAHAVGAARQAPRVIERCKASANQRWAELALRALMRIDDMNGPVRTALESARQRLDELLAA
jgi:ParB-like chromosome segregation protein Spo0J